MSLYPIFSLPESFHLVSSSLRLKHDNITLSPLISVQRGSTLTELCAGVLLLSFVQDDWHLKQTREEQGS